MNLVKGFIRNGQIDTIHPKTNSSTTRSLSFPKITDIIAIIFLDISGNKLVSRVKSYARKSRFLHN
jgi:hypothetical protein